MIGNENFSYQPYFYYIYVVLLLSVTENKLLKRLCIVNKIHGYVFTIYSKNLSVTNSIITRHSYFGDWYFGGDT